MIEFAAPVMGGLAAVAVPLLIHIAHHQRYRRVRWGAMRFLAQLLVERQHRLSLENILLLTVRTGIILCVVAAVMRPQVTMRAEGLGDLIPRTSRTSAILMIDDGLSCAAPSGAPAIDAIKRLAHAYLDTLHTGDDISIIVWSHIADPISDPIYDLTSAHQVVDRLQPTAVGSDVPSLIEAGLDRVSRHLNPEAELVLLSDGCAQGFAAQSQARWERLRMRLRGADDAQLGSRARPHLILLQPPPPPKPMTNCRIDWLHIDRSLLPPGLPVNFRAGISLEGSHALSGLLIRMNVDGRPVAQRPLTLEPGESHEMAFPYTFSGPGSHLVEIAIEGARDALPIDDHRLVAVDVESTLPVLLIEGTPGHGLEGSLGYAAAALDPLDNPHGGLFSLERGGVSLIDDDHLGHARVVIIGDVQALDAAAISSLERFVVRGGGILVAAGAGTNPDIANRFWWRGGDGFLPAGLGSVHDLQSPTHPVILSRSHPAMEAFAHASQDAWMDVAITHLYELVDLSADCDHLLSTIDGAPLLIERPRGRGHVAMLASGLDGQWNDLPFRPSFVPLMRSLIIHLGGTVLPRRNLLVGERLAWFPPTADGVPLAASAEGPHGEALPLTPSAWEGHPALLSEPLREPGPYLVHQAGSSQPTWFQVGIDPAGSSLRALSIVQLSECLGSLTWHLVHDPRRVGDLFTVAGNRRWDLWRPLVFAALTLLLVENWYTFRMAARQRQVQGREP